MAKRTQSAHINFIYILIFISIYLLPLSLASLHPTHHLSQQPTMPSSTRPRNMTIALPYRIFFLYIDPLINLSGIYLAFFDPSTFLASGVPSSLKPSPSSSISHGKPPLDPLVSHLLNSIGSYSVGILVLQVLLLHGFQNAPNGLNVKLCKLARHISVGCDIISQWSRCRWT